ncbi:MAG: MFS transporter, partial [Actinomycetota bacterium]|nr:MFS transporter [Actinomycetota bacterium]
VRAALLALAAGALAAAISEAALLRDAPASRLSERRPYASLLRDRRLSRLSLGSGLLVASQTSVLGFLVLFLHEERGFSTGAGAAILAAVQTIGAVLRIAAGHWSDRVRERIRPLVSLGGALVVALVGSAALVRAPAPLLVLALVSAGALSLSWNGLSFTATAELAGRERSGTALGVQQTALSVAAALTPVIFAAIVDGTSWSAAFAFSAAAALAGTLVLRGLSEPAVAARASAAPSGR